MIASSASPLREIVEAYSRCSASSSVSPSRPLIPMIAFIGVRISWLIVARNALLDSFAASAISRASFTSREQPGVLDRDRRLLREPDQEVEVVVGEQRRGRGPPDRHHADDAPAREERGGHQPFLLVLLGTGDRHPARVAQHVVDHLRGAAAREVADDPLARA